MQFGLRNLFFMLACAAFGVATLFSFSDFFGGMVMLSAATALPILFAAGVIGGIRAARPTPIRGVLHAVLVAGGFAMAFVLMVTDLVYIRYVGGIGEFEGIGARRFFIGATVFVLSLLNAGVGLGIGSLVTVNTHRKIHKRREESKQRAGGAT